MVSLPGDILSRDVGPFIQRKGCLHDDPFPYTLARGTSYGLHLLLSSIGG